MKTQGKAQDLQRPSSGQDLLTYVQGKVVMWKEPRLLQNVTLEDCAMVKLLHESGLPVVRF